MANTQTSDIEASVSQFKRVIDAGAQMLRYSTPGLRDVEALKKIAARVKKSHPEIPLVADVHFQSTVANRAATFCEKVRINPGNFAGSEKDLLEFNQESYEAGLNSARNKLLELIEICKEHECALRIGVNHGSLSSRIMSRYGDTPEGMVESALEYVRICHEAGFHNLVLSLKSSNTRLMVKAVRLLCKIMLLEDLYYPLHLGVTEAGNQLEGRIRSVCGMAPLLMEGMGDTIRVSLTEPPEDEIPVARMIGELFPKPETLPYDRFKVSSIDPFGFSKVSVREVLEVGRGAPVVIGDKGTVYMPAPDIYASRTERGYIFEKQGHSYNVFSLKNEHFPAPSGEGSEAAAFLIDTSEDPARIAQIEKDRLWILDCNAAQPLLVKKWVLNYYDAGGKNPLILKKTFHESNKEKYVLRASGELSLLLIDQMVSGIWIENDDFTSEFNTWLSFQLLQSTRNRFTSTEYIACPSCGRTLFDIQNVLERVKESTAHLTGLTIAVMGCIVNGPGEMADADYGYIGSGKGQVSIYKGKKEVLKKIPEKKAVEALIQIIREHGDWKDP